MLMAIYKLCLIGMLLTITVLIVSGCSFHDDKDQRSLLCEDIKVEITCDAEPTCSWTPQGCKPAGIGP